MLSLLCALLVLVVIMAVVYAIIDKMALDAPVKNIVLMIVGLIFIVVLLGMLFGGIPYPHFAHFRS